MKKAANILLRISGILSIISAIGLTITSIAFLVLSSPAVKDFVMDVVQQSGAAAEYGGDIELAVTTVQGIFVVYGIVFLILGICGIPSAIFSFKGINSSNKTIFILNIIFGLFSGTTFGIVGGIFGLIKGDTIE